MPFLQRRWRGSVETVPAMRVTALKIGEEVRAVYSSMCSPDRDIDPRNAHGDSFQAFGSVKFRLRNLLIAAKIPK